MMINLSKAQKGVVVLSLLYEIFVYIFIAENYDDIIPPFLLMSLPIFLYWSGVWIWGFGYLIDFIGKIKGNQISKIIVEDKKEKNKENDDLSQLLINLIKDIGKLSGIYPLPPREILELSSIYNKCILGMEDMNQEIIDIGQLNLTDSGDEVLLVHTFSKYPEKHSKQWHDAAEKGVYIQEHIDYDENITVKEFYKTLSNDRFFIMDKYRTKNINMDIFNKYITPLIEKFLLDNLYR